MESGLNLCFMKIKFNIKKGDKRKLVLYLKREHQSIKKTTNLRQKK